MVEFPRCAVCRVAVEAGQNVVFRQDGRIAHSECPPVTCPVCGKPIESPQPIRRDRDDRPVHGNCWALLVGRQAPSPGAQRTA